MFEGEPLGGLFASIKHFNDWFSQLPWCRFPDVQVEDPYRTSLPDTRTIKLTHEDLHQGNIIISSAGPPRILAIVDWAHSGWYPDYWEYCKAAYTCWYDGEWRQR
jgi:Phosphotransferase enzyme family